MLKNYWLIAWRTIARNKVYTIINVLGLALGICGCVILYLITDYEFSFDRHRPDVERIYRIVGNRISPDGMEGFLNSPNEDVAGFQTQIPGFESKTAIFDYDGKITVPQQGQPAKNFENHIQNSLYQRSAILTTSSFFAIFPCQWLAGNAQTLEVPNNVVLTESRGHLYFGDLHPADMIGKTIVYDDSLQVHVSGIVQDYQGNTDIGYTDYLSLTTATNSFLKQRIPTADWTSLNPHRSMAFVKLGKGVTPYQIDKELAAYIKDHVKLRRAGTKLTYYLQPLGNLHYTPDYHRGDDGDGWRKPYMPTLYAMMGVAVFILLIATVNFVNLSTAQSMSRAKEVGIRKVMGGRKTSIRLQFLTETLILTLISVVIAALLVNPVFALFRDYVPEGVRFHPLDPATLGFLTIITLLTTLLAGFYPAWVLSGYIPVLSLKGKLTPTGKGSLNLRRALIVFQFTVSLLFITGALVIGKQIAFMHHADKGFNTDRVLSIMDWNDSPQKLATFANTIRTIQGVQKVLLEGTPPMGDAQSMEMYAAKPDPNDLHMVSAHMGNEDYIPFYNMHLVGGRNIFHSDSLRELVINETFAKQLGYKTPQQALGKLLYAAGPRGTIGRAYPIVGVIADFHVSSFHEAIPPAVIENVPERKQTVAIKLAAGEHDAKATREVIDAIKAEWKKQFPDNVFRGVFLDESIAWLFEQETNTAWLVNMAMGVTIFISCMGLFGLGLFTTRRRAKEISIRKVMGASVTAITTLLTRDFAILVGLAFGIATPLAWLATNRWLSDFAYRTSLNWWIFAAAGVAALAIALLTVGFQAVRAALANPIVNLRNE